MVLPARIIEKNSRKIGDFLGNKIFLKFFQKKLAFICDLSYNNTCRRHVTKHSSIAQSVEHLTVNQAVVGSNPTRGAKWRVGQVVKTPPFHGGFTGSNPVRVTILI